MPEAADQSEVLCRSHRRGLLIVALMTAAACLPILVVSQYHSHIRTDDFDSWLFACFGRQLASGSVLYGDVWDNKPPGIFWLNALGCWIGGGGRAGIIGLCAASVLATSLVFFLLTRRVYSLGTAAISTVMAALFLNQQYFHVGTNRPSTFFVLTELLSIFLYVGAIKKSPGRAGVLVWVGFVAGLGIWFKQSALAAAGAMIGHQIMLILFKHQSIQAGGRRLACLCGGLVTSVALMASLLLATADSQAAWYAIVTFNSGYFGAQEGANWLPEWFGVREQLHVLVLPLILGIATLVHALATRLARQTGDAQLKCVANNQPPFWLAMLWLWMITGIYLALLGPHRRLHYFGVALPPLCMLSAHGVYLFFCTGRRLNGTFPPYYVVVALLWCAYMMITPLEDQVHALSRHRFLNEEGQNPRLLMAELIREKSGPKETLFVWGYSPELYYRADRKQAIRYIGTEKADQLGRQGQALMDDIIARLKESPPNVLVVGVDQQKRLRSPRAEDLLDYRDLGAWVEGNYGRIEGANRGDILRRKR